MSISAPKHPPIVKCKDMPLAGGHSECPEDLGGWGFCGARGVRVTLLGPGELLKWTQDEGGLKILLPLGTRAASKHAWGFRVETPAR